MAAISAYLATLVIIFVAIPVAAKINDVIDCEGGYPWAYHLIAYVVLCLGATVEACIYRAAPIKPFGLKDTSQACLSGLSFTQI